MLNVVKHPIPRYARNDNRVIRNDTKLPEMTKQGWNDKKFRDNLYNMPHYYIMPFSSRARERSLPRMPIIVQRSGEFALPVTAILRISATSDTLPL